MAAVFLTVALAARQPTASLAQRRVAPQSLPKGLVQALADNGSLFQEELNHYAYRQTFTFHELDTKGRPLGLYREIRDIIFSPAGERSEQFVGDPVSNLKVMRLTDEDFRDIREVQPFVLTRENLWLYEVVYKGQEEIERQACYVFRLRPRQVLEGQRLLDGLIWVRQDERQIVRTAGRPVPQIYKGGEENLFPTFSTVFEAVDGKFWFPVRTEARDLLPFKTGPRPVSYTIEYEKYQRFTADSNLRFEAPEGALEKR